MKICAHRQMSRKGSVMMMNSKKSVTNQDDHLVVKEYENCIYQYNSQLNHTSR